MIARDVIRPYTRQRWKLMRDNWLTFSGVRLKVEGFDKKCKAVASRLEEMVERVEREGGTKEEEEDVARLQVQVRRDLRELQWYLQLFSTFDHAVQTHGMLDHYERKGRREGMEKADEAAGAVVRVPLLQLKPEYELYHRLVERPTAGDKKKKHVYNERILERLRQEMQSSKYESLSTAQSRLAHLEAAVAHEQER